MHVRHVNADVSNLKMKGEFCLKAMSVESQLFPKEWALVLQREIRIQEG